MHPRVKKIATPLSPLELKQFNTYEGKFEYFRKHCVVCEGPAIHRASTGDEFAIGTCQHDWETPFAEMDAAADALPLFEL